MNQEMISEQEHHYMQYFYNSVNEFLYFIILYIESHGTTCLSIISKHIKFFKIEVATLILSFEGKTLEDKLCQMLSTLDSFKLFDNNVNICKNNSFKDAIFKDLVISKCIDLVLRGINNIDDICNNLNFNNVISIDKKNILEIIDKSSYLSTENEQTVTLHHIHGFIGFEDYISNSVITYFHDILYHDKILSYNDIRNHSRFLSFCGMHNMILILSILNCCKQFDCQNGYVLLKKKLKKYPKPKPLQMEQHEAKFSSRSLPIGQIVYSAYGSCLYKWSGEVGTLTESSGVIYCVVDFTNGYQGVFNICFNETALRVISEVGNLKKYLNLRDVVEFDARYYNGKNLDRCWRATRIKLLNNTKFEYDDHLHNNLCHKSKLMRNKCANNKCCLNDSYASCKNFMHNNSVEVESLKHHGKEKSVLKAANFNDNDSYFVNNSDNVLEIINKNDVNKSTVPNQKSSNNVHSSFYNLLILDYSFMFGFIYMLMADKGIAIAKQGKQNYNILFMMNSVYAPNKSKNLIKGQKVLMLIPYCETLESFCVSTLVYCLNDQEISETAKNNVLPQEFATKVFGDNSARKLICKFCNSFDILNGFMITKGKDFATDLKQRIQLTELYNFISKEYKVPFQNDCLLQFLFGIYKIDCNEESFNRKFFHFIIKLSKYLTKHAASKHRIKSKRKIRRIENADSNSSLNSFKSCISLDSNESFFSCESNFSIPNLAFSSLCNEETCVAATPDNGMPLKTDYKLQQVKPCLGVQEKNLKHRLKFMNRPKYLCLRSVPCLKHTVKKKRRMILPTVLKSVCRNCFKSSVTLAAYVSLISSSFFFYTLNIDGYNVTLPLPRQVIPPDLQGNMKLNSYSEITVIPNVLANLSHIIAANVFT